MNSSNGVTLLYEHPHIEMYVYDNTGYTDETVSITTPSFNGIQVGFFGGGRDNTLMYTRNTTELINEFQDMNYKLYGQAGYNAYNALDSGAGMYIMNLRPDNAAHANCVVMAKYKLMESEVVVPPITGNDTLSLTGTNPIKELIPSEEDNDITTGAATFTFKGEVTSGLSGDPNVDNLFSHITSEWLACNNLGNFTVATLKIPVPNGVVVGENVTIKQTSAALKKFYSDFGEDASHIVANEDGVTATKTRTYSATDLLGEDTFITLGILVSESDTIFLDINWGDSEESLVLYTTDLTFVVPNTEDTTEKKTPKKLGICYEVKSIPNATSINKLMVEIANMYNEEVDADGYFYRPLMAFWSLGRGICGNSIRIKFSDGNTYNGLDDPTSRTYRLDVMENTKAGLKRREYSYGMLDEDAYDASSSNGASLYFPDMFNEMDFGSGKINMYFNPIVMEHMMKLINDELGEGEDEDAYETVETFDPIFGLNTDGTADDNIIMIDNYNSEAYVNLSAADGFCLGNGDDGDLDLSTHTEQEVADAKEDLLNRAFDGTLDRRILSRFSAPADFCLDANFPDSVKATMARFAAIRKYDCMTYVDTKLNKTTQDVIAYLKSISNLNANNLIKETHCYRYRDTKFTGKACEMTITHWFAKNLPKHMLYYGMGIPFAKERAIISNTSDFISNSFLPVIDPDDHETKAAIHKYGANCFETVKYNVYQRSSTQTTYKETKSDRKEEFNEYITQRACRLAYNLLNSKLYNVAEEDDRARFTTDAEKVIEVNLRGLVKTCSVSFEMSAQDKRMSVLRLKLRLTFNTVAKYGVCEVYLDPRVDESELLVTA